MTNNKAVQKIQALLSRVAKKLKLPARRLTKTKRKEEQQQNKLSFEGTHSLAFQLFGAKTGRILPLFDDLDVRLQRSGLKVNFKAYISLTVFASILTSFVALAIIPCLAFILFRVPVLPAFLFGVGGGLFAFAFSIVGFYLYPVYRADKLKREIDDELPFTTGYMAILGSAGVSPEKIFHSLSSMSVPLVVSSEAKDIVRDISLFGRDVISALEAESVRTPSERFRELMEGLISTIHSGGNLPAYLREKSKQYMRLKRISLKKFSDTLSILSEFYVTILVTGPLLLVIMLAVMAMLGGGTLGVLSPDLILNLLTYIGIPLASIMFLIILDAISPKW
jgi:flagellar protein FlaJ